MTSFSSLPPRYMWRWLPYAWLVLGLTGVWLLGRIDAQRIVAVFSTSRRHILPSLGLSNEAPVASNGTPIGAPLAAPTFPPASAFTDDLPFVDRPSKSSSSSESDPEDSQGESDRFGRQLTGSPNDLANNNLFIMPPSEMVASENGSVEGKRFCHAAKECKPGVILPLWLPTEIPTNTRIVRSLVYLAAMMYLFYGISIVSDRFMAAIEVITSQECEVEVVKPNGQRTLVLVSVWNETVSNLTLMALGSSAPEILLSIIEIFGNNFEAGELGPSTIVGSAAFNLFIIIAICIYVIPSNEIRRVHRIDVFWITVAFSMFAYIWLYFILSVSSPNIVEVWEGVLTFLFFPLTVACAFVTNKHLPAFGQRLISRTKIPSFIRRSPPRMGAPRGRGLSHGSILTLAPNGHATARIGDVESRLLGPSANNERRTTFETFRRLRAAHPDLTLEELEQMVARETPKSRAFYRIQATHKMTGSGSLIRKKLAARPEDNDDTLPLPLMPAKPKRVAVGFHPINYICMESVGTLYLNVEADRGSLQVSTEITVHYRTVADTAQDHDDFIPTEGILRFRPNETTKTIGVAIVDNDVYEEDEQFFVELFDVSAHVAGNEMQKLPAHVDADTGTAIVTIVDDDHGGTFSFNSEAFRIPENAGIFQLEVRRHRGARSDVILPYRVINGTAKNGTDFIVQDGQLLFRDGETRKNIDIEIINDDEYEKAEDFFVEINAPISQDAQRAAPPAAGAPDGRPILGAHRRCRITIIEDKEFKGFVDRVLTEANTTFLVGSSSWWNQFRDAISYDDINGDGSISGQEKFLHYLSLPWKLTFALIPPTDYFNGWLCFIVAIIAIGMLTAVIGDVAAMFGCTVGIDDSVTAITLVAIGTSLPDTFASKTAAVQNKTADASIGNVTGSNAVNVFLGIGVAWVIAAVYHAWHGRPFRVEAGSLASSVSLFVVGAAICLVVLQWRRYSPEVGGELGGPARIKMISTVIFVSIWLIYIIYCALVAYCILPGF